MGREIRMVPKDWEHPKNENGSYIPLYDGSFKDCDEEWMAEWEKWKEGLCRSYRAEERWEPIDEANKKMLFSDYSGRRPNQEDYMPEWKDEEKTHLQMYETCSEGSPISPVMETPEELARWLADTGASSFGSMTATYDQWLRVCKGGYAPSAVMVTGGPLVSGVAGLPAS